MVQCGVEFQVMVCGVCVGGGQAGVGLAECVTGAAEVKEEEEEEEVEAIVKKCAHVRQQVCCSVLQCVAVCCSVLQCVAACRSVLQYVAVCFSMLQCQSLRSAHTCVSR